LLVTSKHQACTGAALPKTAAALRNAHTRIRLKSSRAARKISRDVSRILHSKRFGNTIHDAPGAFYRTVVGELLEDYRGIHTVEDRNKMRGIGSRLLMAGAAIQSNKSTTLHIAGVNLAEGRESGRGWPRSRQDRSAFVAEV